MQTALGIVALLLPLRDTLQLFSLSTSALQQGDFIDYGQLMVVPLSVAIGFID